MPSDAVEFARAEPAAEFDARRDVAPLVAAADLHPAVERVGEVHEVPGLQQHVAELGVGEAAVALEPALHRVLAEHLRKRHVLADIAEEFEVADAPHPVGIVDDVVGGDRRTSADFMACVAQENSPDLPLDPSDIGRQFIGREKVAFLAPPARVADHAGRATDQGHRFVAGVGHATQQHERHKMPDVEAVGRGVEAGIDATAGRGEPLTELARVGRLVNQAAGLEIGDKVVCH